MDCHKSRKDDKRKLPRDRRLKRGKNGRYFHIRIKSKKFGRGRKR